MAEMESTVTHRSKSYSKKCTTMHLHVLTVVQSRQIEDMASARCAKQHFMALCENTAFLILTKLNYIDLHLYVQLCSIDVIETIYHSP